MTLRRVSGVESAGDGDFGHAEDGGVAKDGAYVLIYARNPDWRFAAKRYKLERSASGGQTVTYTDFQDGGEYKMELSADWPRAWTVHEIEVLSANAFEEIWQRPRDPRPEPKK